MSVSLLLIIYVWLLKVQVSISKLLCPKSRPLFKIKSNVVTDNIFRDRLIENMKIWIDVKSLGSPVLSWWELLVKPGIIRLAIERGKELNKEKNSKLNMMLLRQSYLNRKIQRGQLDLFWELKRIKIQVDQWYKDEVDRVKIQSKTQEIDTAESVRIYHHELHKKKIKKSSILTLDTEDGRLEGHDKCANYLENVVSNLLLHSHDPDPVAEETLGLVNIFQNFILRFR